MTHRPQYFYFSHLFLFIIASANILDLITGGKLSALFELKPVIVIENMELWRLFTFPFASDSIEGTILFLFTFFIFSPKLEAIFQNWLYPLMLFIMIFLQGTIFTVIFWKSNIVIAGMGGLSFFVLTIFTLVNIKKSLIIFKKKLIKIYAFVFSITLLWFLSLFVHSILSESSILIFKGAYSLIYGVSTGLIIFLQLKFMKSSQHQTELRDKNKSPIMPSAEELSLKVIANKELKKINQELEAEFYHKENQFELSEDKLNEILDKINENGKESLSDSERFFLDEYSKYLS